MADIWVPEFKRAPSSVSRRTYDRLENKKLLLHTTEGDSLESAERAFARYPPHIGACRRTRQVRQYLPLNVPAKALRNSESEDEPVIQVELVGFANGSPDWSAEDLEWLAFEVFAPIYALWPFDLAAAPQGFHGPDEGITPYLASARSPMRFSMADFIAFSGVCGHQHAPAPDHHWDPGAIDIETILNHLRTPTPEEDMTLTFTERLRAEYSRHLNKQPTQGEINEWALWLTDGNGEAQEIWAYIEWTGANA